MQTDKIGIGLGFLTPANIQCLKDSDNRMAPDNSWGHDGDYYLDANKGLYHKESGAWVAIKYGVLIIGRRPPNNDNNHNQNFFEFESLD